MISEGKGRGGIKHFRISKSNGVNMFMLLTVGYGYFLESPIGRVKLGSMCNFSLVFPNLSQSVER